MSSKCDGKYDDDDDDNYDEKLGDGKQDYDLPKVEVTSIRIEPDDGELHDPFELKILFEIDRDVVAAFWRVKVNFLLKLMSSTDF